MKSSHSPFRINTGFLINQPIGYARAIPFDLASYDFGEDFSVSDISGTVELTRTQDGLRALADLSASCEDQCGRCLDVFSNRLHTTFEEYFTFPFVEPSEDETAVAEDGNIDLEPIIHDYLMMENNINPLCREDCKGLCDICGQNLNHANCAHNSDDTSEAEKETIHKSASAEESPAV